MSQQLITPAAARLHLSPTLAINELVLRTRATGKTVIHLGFGEATFPIPKDVLKAHVDASSSTSYLPVAGLQVLRKVFCIDLYIFLTTNTFSVNRSI